MNAQTNISEVLNLKVNVLTQLERPDEMLRAVASAVLPAIRKRVHVDGIATDGGLIGTYSKSYMQVRTGNFADSARFKRGAKKGQFKEKKSQAKGDAGKYTKGRYKGAPRRVYNRTADTKVIGSLTRQMENDLSVVPSPPGYGIGFKNSANFDKSQWLESTYGKRIWGLTAGEIDLAFTVANDYVQNAFKQ